jgi:hypothetical protein
MSANFTGVGRGTPVGEPERGGDRVVVTLSTTPFTKS